MKLATFEKNGQHRLGVVLAEQTALLDLAATHQAVTGAVSPWFADMLALIDGGAAALALARTYLAPPPAAVVYPLTDVRLLAPLLEPRQIRDCMVFEEHLKNASAQAEKLTGRTSAIPPVWYEQPLYYKANRFSVIGTDQDVHWPAYSNVMDFELELACIIGRTGIDIPRAEAAQYIFGFTIFNDCSARDVQFKEMAGQLGPAKGKDFDTGNVFGPWIVTTDELGDPYNLRMTARVNGEVWGGGHSGTMYHKFEDIIAFISRSETLHAGEIIGSGTVGTGCGLELGRYLSPGDVVELDIEKIGILRNRFLK
jgi:2-keto-4-pentenoate hydratase/2-oxohepta-3-ene-1,7-dioic acid hydratase in catechol pathway